MKIEYVTVVKSDGEKVEGTKVRTKKGTEIVFTKKLTRKEVEQEVRKYERNPKRIAGLARSVKKFEEFNWKKPRTITKRILPFDVPLVRIGKVPIITYMSNKEGKMRAYKHETKRMPTLYMHPTKQVGLLIGGSMKVREWLYD